MKLKTLQIFSGFLCLLFLANLSFSAEIRGRVFAEDNTPFAETNVYLQGTILGSTTNQNGEFFIKNVPMGKFTISVSVIGYHQQDISLSITDEKIYNLGSIRLTPSPIAGEPVVVTASKYQQKIQEVPVSISSFGKKEIDYRNSVTIDQALQYVPGVNMNSSQMNIRGSSGYSKGVGSRVLFLLDGIPFLTGDTREINYETIPTYLVDHVEVLKGAGSALYGSSALGGVVNIITRDIAKPGTHYYLKYYGGTYSQPSFGQWKWSEGHRYLNGGSFTISHKKNKMSMLLGASRDQDDGYRENDWTRRYSGSGKFRWEISPFQQLTISGNYMTKKRGNFLFWQDVNHALEPPPEQRDDRVQTERLYLTSHYRYIFNKKQYVTFRGIWYQGLVKDNVSDGRNNQAKSKNVNLEVQFNSQIGKAIFTTGIEGTWNGVKSDMFGNRNGLGSAIYAQGEYPLIEKLKATIGLRFDYFDIDSIQSDQQLNPKFGFVYRFNKGVAFRTSFGLGFRAPSVAEAFTSTSASGFRIIPNTHLLPEKSTYFELGWNQIISSHLVADAALFYSRFSDLIEGSILKTVEIQFQNITSARIRGAEIDLSGQALNKKLHFGLNYTYVDPWDLEQNKFLNFRPRHIFKVLLQNQIKFLNVGLDYRFISKYDRIDERFALLIQDAESRVDMHVVDLHFSSSFNLSGMPLQASLQINNLFRYNYVDLVGALAPLRNFVISLQTNF